MCHCGSKRLVGYPKLFNKLTIQVRDEKGRKRFHGAFTGGFSAGYFNSVGSKEGEIMRRGQV